MTTTDSVGGKNIDVELKSDQSWKKIQQNTFTRWVNQHLKNADLSIHDLVICFDFFNTKLNSK